MSAASAVISMVLAQDKKLNLDAEENIPSKSYDAAIYELMSQFDIVSSNSGGSWFTYAFLLSTTFNNILKEMTKCYLLHKANIDNDVCEKIISDWEYEGEFIFFKLLFTITF